MWQVGASVGDFVDIEEHGAGNMPGAIFFMRIAAFTRQQERTVDDHEIWFAEMRGKPFRRDKQIIAHRRTFFRGRAV